MNASSTVGNQHWHAAVLIVLLSDAEQGQFLRVFAVYVQSLTDVHDVRPTDAMGRGRETELFLSTVRTQKRIFFLATTQFTLQLHK